MLVAHLPLLTVAAIVIIAREITISALREWMAEIGKRASVAVSLVSKVKTVVQMLAVILLLASSHRHLGSLHHTLYLWLGYVLLYCAVALNAMVYVRLFTSRLAVFCSAICQ